MATVLISGQDLQRRRLVIKGQVQGVGFRPTIYRLANIADVSGFVANTTQGVVIEVQGTSSRLAHFRHLIAQHAPPAARIRTIVEDAIDLEVNEAGFRIQTSRQHGAGGVSITPDMAICDNCRRELLDPEDRRFHYALNNCTHCGPRYSIILDTPYDRSATTMATFMMCPECSREYADLGDRRFHAQPVCCPDCGPKIQLVDPRGTPLPGNPVERAAEMLSRGAIVAIKGIGGFHLAVRADSESAVSRLRRLKKRDAKPMAVMCRSLHEVDRLVDVSLSGRSALMSPAAPIVLAMRRSGAPVAEGVAGRNCRLGVMLPYAPIHHLLFHHLNTAIPALVMTSGNMTDEPLAVDNAEALDRLGNLCDALLWHDRPIARSVDDSVILDMGPAQNPMPIRRSRGWVPAGVPVNVSDSICGVCLGGELKSTVALLTHSQAILSQHLGDLSSPLARTRFIQTIHDLCRLYRSQPQFIAHDLHPMYVSAQCAAQLSSQFGVPLVAVQHHHAHAASVMAEHGTTDPVLALICDGTGLGLDSTGWGCELLVATAENFRRVASLHPLILPGGDAAARGISRSALAILYQTLGDDFDQHPAARRLVKDDNDRKILKFMITRTLHSVISSSAGRVFDGVAALLGISTENSFEAQAPMELESAAVHGGRPEVHGPFWSTYRDEQAVERLDLRALYRKLLHLREKESASAESLAALFHIQFAAAWEDVIVRAADVNQISTVGLSGGVFANQFFTNEITCRLQQRGLTVLRHQVVPPNDGGLALGQALVAAARWEKQRDGHAYSTKENVACV